MQKGTTHVGMDVHKKDIAVAMLVAGSAEPVSWTVANEETAVRRLAKKLRRESSGEVVCAYEAGRAATPCRGSCEVTRSPVRWWPRR